MAQTVDMGIQDRDYMRRPPDDDDERSSSADSRAEAFFSRFFEKHPRFFLYLLVGLGVLLLMALLVAKLSGSSR